jgi:hypothetical protein
LVDDQPEIFSRTAQRREPLQQHVPNEIGSLRFAFAPLFQAPQLFPHLGRSLPENLHEGLPIRLLAHGHPHPGHSARYTAAQAPATVSRWSRFRIIGGKAEANVDQRDKILVARTLLSRLHEILVGCPGHTRAHTRTSSPIQSQSVHFSPCVIGFPHLGHTSGSSHRLNA